MGFVEFPPDSFFRVLNVEGLYPSVTGINNSLHPRGHTLKRDMLHGRHFSEINFQIRFGAWLNKNIIKY